MKAQINSLAVRKELEISRFKSKNEIKPISVNYFMILGVSILLSVILYNIVANGVPI